MKVSECLIPSESSKGESVPSLSSSPGSFSAICDIPCLKHPSIYLYIYVHIAFSLNIYWCNQGSLCIRITLDIILIILILIICQTYFQIRSHSQGQRVRTSLSYGSGENIFQCNLASLLYCQSCAFSIGSFSSIFAGFPSLKANSQKLTQCLCLLCPLCSLHELHSG